MKRTGVDCGEGVLDPLHGGLETVWLFFGESQWGNSYQDKNILAELYSIINELQNL